MWNYQHRINHIEVKNLMKRNNTTFIFIIFLFIITACTKKQEDYTNKKISIKDDLGDLVNFDKTPKRIVSLAPNLTEMLFDLGLGSKIVGNTTFCNYPKEASKIIRVGDMLTLDFEKLMLLKPDLIFITVEGNQRSVYEKLKELKFSVFVSNPRNLEGIKKTYTDIGKIFGKDKIASEEILKWETTVSKITKIALQYDSSSVLFAMSYSPLICAGKNTFLHEMITIAGLKNSVADSPVNYPVLNKEEVMQRNPDYILIGHNEKAPVSQLLKLYPEWINLDVIKKNRVIEIDADLYLRPGPRFVDAVKDLFLKIHPREFQNLQ